jgi:hypothetical protein
MATSAGFPKEAASLSKPCSPAIADEVANLERGGRLEGVKPTSSLVELCRAAVGLACAPAVKLMRGMAH